MKHHNYEKDPKKGYKLPKIPLNQRKKKCSHGHTFTPETTFIDVHGWRHCRICQRVSWRKRNQKSKVKNYLTAKNEDSGLKTFAKIAEEIYIETGELWTPHTLENDCKRALKLLRKNPLVRLLYKESKANDQAFVILRKIFH